MTRAFPRIFLHPILLILNEEIQFLSKHQDSPRTDLYQLVHVGRIFYDLREFSSSIESSLQCLGNTDPCLTAGLVPRDRLTLASRFKRKCSAQYHLLDRQIGFRQGAEPQSMTRGFIPGPSVVTWHASFPVRQLAAEELGGAALARKNNEGGSFTHPNQALAVR